LSRVPTFALIGAGGYVAPKHLSAIREIGGDLLCAMDLSDSVGVLDSYFPLAAFYTEESAFWTAVQENPPTYVIVCTPNHLHTSHTLMALRAGANVICEKPLVVDLQDLQRLQEAASTTGRKVYPVLQLRLHPEIMKLRQAEFSETQRVSLRYLTRRGPWYLRSWKGDDSLSGGLLMNIGVHFFDTLIDIYGAVVSFEIKGIGPRRAAGSLVLENACVEWELSIAAEDLPSLKTAVRQLVVGGKTIDFTNGFAELHAETYRRILQGDGFSLEDVRPSLELIDRLRRVPVT
jgi:UDP-N-acetyl-2-amino-2-deoxyglucuronate dehydrogenase